MITTEEKTTTDQRKGWCKIIETEKRDFLFQVLEDEEFDRLLKLRCHRKVLRLF